MIIVGIRCPNKGGVEGMLLSINILQSYFHIQDIQRYSLSLELKRFEFRAREFSDISYYMVIVLT
jgi:hypothetical protein